MVHATSSSNDPPNGQLTVAIVQTQRVPVRYLRAECGVRYWEDATVNGVEDTEGNLIPLRDGDAWAPTIDLTTGKIDGWPQGTTADIHYKVCDEGTYTLLGPDRSPVQGVNGYVIPMMCPEENGFGDYVIMKVAEDGTIANWKVDLDAFERGD